MLSASLLIQQLAFDCKLCVCLEAATVVKHCISKQSCIKQRHSDGVTMKLRSALYLSNSTLWYKCVQVYVTDTFSVFSASLWGVSTTAALRCQVSSTAGRRWAHSHKPTESPDQ